MNFRIIIIYLSFFLLSNINAFAQTDKHLNTNKQVPPDICSVDARIVKVIPSWKKISRKICKESPCLARIEINKVNKKGRSFPQKFKQGQIIEVKFDHSLKAKDNCIKKGDEYKVVISAKPILNSNEYTYIIDSYKKME